MSSGQDWSDRMRVLAARAPNLDIFSDKLVLREDSGWLITDSGRQLLSSLERPVREQPLVKEGTEVDEALADAKPIPPALRLVVDNTQSPRSDSELDGTRRSA
jgi:hypothetical protein